MTDETLLFVVCAVAAALYFAYRYFVLNNQVNEEVQRRTQQWRQRELDAHKNQMLEIARREATIELEQWKRTHTKELRQDAIQRSQAVTVGKVTEHLIPYLPGFTFDPRDARFLGTPIDFVVFDGLCSGEVKQIVFVEVKTANARLSSRERTVKTAVEAGRLTWLEVRSASLGGLSNTTPK